MYETHETPETYDTSETHETYETSETHETYETPETSETYETPETYGTYETPCRNIPLPFNGTLKTIESLVLKKKILTKINEILTCV